MEISLLAVSDRMADLVAGDRGGGSVGIVVIEEAEDSSLVATPRSVNTELNVGGRAGRTWSGSDILAQAPRTTIPNDRVANSAVCIGKS